MKGFIFTLCCCLGLVASAQNDDVYYIPTKSVKKVRVADKTYESVPAQDMTVGDNSYTTTATPSTYTTRDIDEYNRRGSARPTDETVDEVESTFDESYDTQSCTKLIVRFHSPSAVIVSSPYYWDVCYSNVWDVYYDTWAFGLPSWGYWSYAYDPWYYNRWWHRTCWDYTWGWHDPWWGYSYWGWGHPVYWGWHRPGGWGIAHHPVYHHHWGGHYQPGFGHRLDGGRNLATNGGRTYRGSQGGLITQGTFGSRGNGLASQSSRGGLSKGFRVNTQPSRGLARNGSVSRGQASRGTSTSTATARQQASRQYQRSISSQPSRQQTTPQMPSRNTPSTPSRSSSSSSTVGGGMSHGSTGGGVSSGGGFSRGGGGGFSRSGGRR